MAQVRANGIITNEVSIKTLNMLGIDDDGLDEMDRKILLCLIEKFNGGPVGLSTIGTAIAEEKDTLEEVYEPYLIQKGFIKRTPRGRMATHKAYKKLDRTMPTGSQEELF